jgi:amino acid transporter
VLPSFLGSRGRGSGSPVAGSLLQSVLGIILIAIFALMHKDPLTQFFTWLSYVAAVGVLLLMFSGSIAVIGYFGRRPGSVENVWQKMIAPILAIIALGAILAITIINSDSVLGTTHGSVLSIVLPALVGVAAVVGLIWGLIIKSSRPDVYANIGRGLGDDDDELESPSANLPRARHGADAGRRLQV